MEWYIQANVNFEYPISFDLINMYNEFEYVINYVESVTFAIDQSINQSGRCIFLFTCCDLTDHQVFY